MRVEAVASADPALVNFLNNLRDHDIDIFSTATLYVGRGATFAVRRTVLPEHHDVVFKTTLRSLDRIDKTDEARRLEALLLELRVLTHPPLRDHDNIVKLLQVGWEGDAVDVSRIWPVLVMEYADLGTLVDYFDREPETPWTARRMFCQDVANGLLALHHCGIVHGDLKLENVLVTSTKDEGRLVRAKLSDFGGALLDSDTSESVRMATPPWNAPEWRIARPRNQLINSDVYSLGLLIWQIVLNGRNPFDDAELFTPLSTRRGFLARLDEEKAMDSLFLSKAKQSVAKWSVDGDQALISNIFDVSIRVDEAERHLDRVVDLVSSPSKR
jgi:serine/threonine protein kinase